eukprot:CAMPEP_0176128384 /NCGR_PEP_ID=MMETSP0120_2-20121206/64871_1 /TAXON_ID=160619 /ORGANISM="Kryptoperidinium foliaceum, Strain CCMP 1326" /LENGTH=33 /DNA_ID= /DNA_START= /DNA_END= /DNA_ORIENTATION=
MKTVAQFLIYIAALAGAKATDPEQEARSMLSAT